VVADVDDESSFRMRSQAANAIAIATATAAPIRTLGKRLEPAPVRSVIATEDRFRSGGEGPAVRPGTTV
jgi:hypothetical protein